MQKVNINTYYSTKYGHDCDSFLMSSVFFFWGGWMSLAPQTLCSIHLKATFSITKGCGTSFTVECL